MAFNKNKVKIDLCSYPPYMFLAPKKFGKTTFWYELVKEAWGSDEKGLLVSFANEEGYHSLDGIQVEVAKEWNAEYDKDTELRGFIQIVDDIIDNNSEYGIKGICFDTFDTMVDVATREVFRQHKKEKGTICKSLNDAFSGYGRGKSRLLELIDTQVDRLRSIGIAVFYLCHIKNKEKTDLISGEKYEMITNNLTDDIYSHIADAAQMVMVGALDREINNGKILNENRVVYLRGNSTIDAGGRFTDIPEKIELSPKSFLNAFEYAVKSSMKNPMSDKEIEKAKKQEIKQREEKAEKAVTADKKKKDESDENKEELIQIIVANFSNASDEIKAKAKEILANNKCSKFTEESLPISALREIVELLA
jgi:hypothetical protein